MKGSAGKSVWVLTPFCSFKQISNLGRIRWVGRRLGFSRLVPSCRGSWSSGVVVAEASAAPDCLQFSAQNCGSNDEFTEKNQAHGTGSVQNATVAHASHREARAPKTFHSCQQLQIFFLFLFLSRRRVLMPVMWKSSTMRSLVHVKCINNICS